MGKMKWTKIAGIVVIILAFIAFSFCGNDEGEITQLEEKKKLLEEKKALLEEIEQLEAEIAQLEENKELSEEEKAQLDEKKTSLEEISPSGEEKVLLGEEITKLEEDIAQLEGDKKQPSTECEFPEEANLISNIYPTFGPSIGGTEVTIEGQGFKEGLTVCFGNNKADDITLEGETIIKVKTPAVTMDRSMAYDVVVVNSDGSGDNVRGGFGFVKPVDASTLDEIECEEPDPLGKTITVYGCVVDFENESPIAYATISIWFDNDVSHPPDISRQYSSDEEGHAGPFEGVPARRHIAVLVSDASGQKPTYKYNFLMPDADVSRDDTADCWDEGDYKGKGYLEFLSISEYTFMVIPRLLRITPDKEKGAVAGTVRDCNGEPIQNAVIRIFKKDTKEDISDYVYINYFINEFPKPRWEQFPTSDDGIFGMFDVPVGEYILKAFVFDTNKNEFVQIGEAEIVSNADAINISNIEPFK